MRYRLNEAVDFKSSEIVPTPTPVANQTKVGRRRRVKPIFSGLPPERSKIIADLKFQRIPNLVMMQHRRPRAGCETAPPTRGVTLASQNVAAVLGIILST